MRRRKGGKGGAGEEKRKRKSKRRTMRKRRKFRSDHGPLRGISYPLRLALVCMLASL